MLVSIIIPHFNRTALLAETLASVRAQTYSNWEVIIVDDGSDQEEWERLQRLRDDKIIIKQRTGGLKGPSGCRNIGVSDAQGGYLLFLDSDDLLAPFCLEQRMSAMQQHPDLDLGIFLMEEFTTTPGDSGKIFNSDAPPSTWMHAFLGNQNPWAVTCPIWKRSFFHQIEGFDEKFLFMEDPDIHLRAILAGGKIKTFYTNPADCFYRIGYPDATKSLFWYNSILYRIAFYAKVLQNPSLPISEPSIRASIRKGIHQLIKVFLYHRKNDFPELYARFTKLLGDKRVFSAMDAQRLRSLIEFGNSNSALAKMLHAKGLCYRLLP